MFLFVNKCYGYGDAAADHYYIALNSRMSEIQGAVALGQFEKLDECARLREDAAADLTEKIHGIRGIRPFPVAEGARNVYWKYCLIVDSDVVPGGAVGLAAGLKARGISSAPRYIQKPAFQCEIFQKQKTFGSSRFPFSLARPEACDYSPERYPGAFHGLEHTLVLPWNEKYTAQHVDYIASSIQEVVNSL
jgi:dTDP-4-amino-4,6-dideoxygalactose transaminase